MIWQAIVAVETFSLMASLTRFFKKDAAGHYNNLRSDDIGPFVGALLGGLLPIFMIPYVLGNWLHQRDLRLAQEKKEQQSLEQFQEEVRRMTG